MKIAQVAPLTTEVSVNSKSPVGRQIYFLTEELVKRGHEVTLFATEDSVTSAKLEAQSIIAKYGRMWMMFHLTMLEQVFSQQDNFTLIHNHIEYSAAPLAYREPVNIISTLYNPFVIPAKLLYEYYTNFIIVPLSKCQKQYPFPHLNWYEVIYPGLPADLYPFQKLTGQYLCYLGPITPLSGVTTAIEIALRTGINLKIAYESHHFDKEFYLEIKPLCERPGIEFMGEIQSYQERKELIQNSLALFLPYNHDGQFNFIMLEALAFGTPLFSFSYWIASEIIQQGETGFLFENINEAVQYINKIADLKRENCRDFFEANFTIERIADQYIKLYEKKTKGKVYVKERV